MDHLLKLYQYPLIRYSRWKPPPSILQEAELKQEKVSLFYVNTHTYTFVHTSAQVSATLKTNSSTYIKNVQHFLSEKSIFNL